MQGQDKVVLAGGGLDHMGAQQRPALQVKRLMRLAVGQGLQTLLTDTIEIVGL